MVADEDHVQSGSGDGVGAVPTTASHSENLSKKTNTKLSAIAITVVVVLLPVILAVRLVLNFRNQYFLTHVDGAWLTCAHDFAQGVLYRPLFGPMGYGGTRYFPLYFVLTGGLSALGANLVDAGLILSAASIVLLAWACYVVLRRLKVSFLVSVAAAAGICAVTTAQQSLLETKGDGLAAMFNLWGLAFCTGAKTPRGWLYLSAIFFTLAFAAKLTTVFGFIAVMVYWVLIRRYKEAWQLGLMTVAGYSLVLLATYAGSDGRVVQIFRACATGGGSLSYALQAPLHMIVMALQFDRIMLLVLITAIVLGVCWFKEAGDSFLYVYFGLVLLMTIAIFSSFGIKNNHLLDLHVAAVMLIAFVISRSPATAKTGTYVFAILLVIAFGATIARTVHDFRRPSLRAEILQVLEQLPADNRPVLAENPVVVLKQGKTPYLLDPWMFCMLNSKDPAFGRDMWQRMTHQRFAAIVLENDPRTLRGREWYQYVHFGGEFLRDLEANYSFSNRIGDMYIYTPNAHP